MWSHWRTENKPPGPPPLHPTTPCSPPKELAAATTARPGLLSMSLGEPNLPGCWMRSRNQPGPAQPPSDGKPPPSGCLQGSPLFPEIGEFNGLRFQPTSSAWFCALHQSCWHKKTRPLSWGTTISWIVLVWHVCWSHRVKVGVHQRYVVVTGDDVAESRQTLLNSLDPHGVWEAVSDVLQLLVCGVVGHQEAVTVTWQHTDEKGWVEKFHKQTNWREKDGKDQHFTEVKCVWALLTDTHPSYDATASYGCMNDWDGFWQLPFKHTAVTNKSIMHPNTVTHGLGFVCTCRIIPNSIIWNAELLNVYSWHNRMGQNFITKWEFIVGKKV